MSSLAAFEAQSGDDPVAFDQFVSSLHHEWHVGFDNAFVISRSPDGTASVRYGAPYPAPFPPEHDLLEDPDRRSAMQESIDLGLPVMGPVGLLQAQPARSRGHADVIEVYTPIFEPGPIPATAKVLERAGLIARRREGKARPSELVAAPLAEASEWLEPYSELWQGRLDRLGDHLRSIEAKGNAHE